MLFARVAGMAAGGSGVSPARARRARRACSMRGVHPRRARASARSASPTCAPLSHLALPLIGEGEAEFDGDVDAGRRGAARAPASRPSTLGAQGRARAHQRQRGDASATPRWCSHDAPRARRARRRRSRCRSRAFAPTCRRSIRARRRRGRRRGQVEVAARLRALLDGSALLARRRRAPRAGSAVAFAASRRCTARRSRRCDARATHVELELNSAADSPLVLAADGEMLSNGNFHMPALALALDALATRARAMRERSRVERCHALHVARVHRPAAAADAPRARALRLRDDPEDADGAAERDAACAPIRRRSTSCRCRKASRTTRR